MPKRAAIAALAACLLLSLTVAPVTAAEPPAAVLALSGVSAERDAGAGLGLRPGVLYRSAKLCKTPKSVDAAEDGPAWVDCTRGRDRTGWLVIVLGHIAGADPVLIRAEYLRTSGARSSDYARGLASVTTRWGGWEGYLTRGLGLTPATLDALRAKLSLTRQAPPA